MTTEEKIKDAILKTCVVLNKNTGTPRAVKTIGDLLASEIREAKIKILEELKAKTKQAIVNLLNEPFYEETLKNKARVNALKWQINEFDNLISELKEEGNEKV